MLLIIGLAVSYSLSVLAPHVYSRFIRQGIQLERVDNFRTSLPGIDAIPDPLHLYTLNQWYILDAVSENLVRYNYAGGNYEPVLAESWTINGKSFRFKLRKDLKFHDGSPLGLEDVLASFNRIIRVRTSTHYQMWRHLKDCAVEGGICKSIRIEGDQFVIDLNGEDFASFFLFLSSPEGAIWSKNDLDKSNFKPTKFSGFYYPSSKFGPLKAFG